MRVIPLLALLAPLPLVSLFACGQDDDEKSYEVGPSGCIIGYVPCGDVCVPEGSCTEPGVGGTSGSGGSTSGGTLGTGSFASTGGLTGTGSGGATTGGVTNTGGGTNTGGITNTGGVTNTGGITNTGGVQVVKTCAVQTGACSDTSTTSDSVNTAFGYARVTVNGNATTDILKTYMFSSNWWSDYDGQSISIDGLSFRINGNTPDDGNDAPAGFPTLYIGNYQGRATACSDLPKQVSAINEIPTKFHVNAPNHGNYNATYDVWFTASSAALPASQSNPGGGGAYLMVWLWDPAQRQPVGGPNGGARSVNGVSGTWQPWVGNLSGIPVISYLATSDLTGLDFDLNDFIQDAVSHNYGVTNSQYLSVVFAGMEVWGGADGAEITNFCVDVR